MWDAIVDRQLGFVNFTSEIMQKLRQARLLVVGAGGNGSVLDLLVRTGFMNFTIIDDDTVDPTNLNRLPFTSAAIGKLKVDAWHEHLLSINPDCKITTHAKALSRHDATWFKELLPQIDLVFLGTTDPEANLVAGRLCAQNQVRMIIGPASSGSWVVSTFCHTDPKLNVETLAGFGTENQSLLDIDYQAIIPKYLQALAYPGRSDKLLPGVREKVWQNQLPARSCGLFVHLTNIAMAWEAVKNIMELNNLELQDTQLIKIPLIQIFDPYSGCSYLYNVMTKKIGIPNWLTKKTEFFEM